MQKTIQDYIQELKDFFIANRNTCLIGIGIILLCLFGAWLYHDSHRNDGVYNNTNETVERLEKRINRIETRIGTMQDRLDKAEKTVSGVAERVERSRENAVAVADGISGTEERLESAIQRSGRVQNIISDIENANR